MGNFESGFHYGQYWGRRGTRINYLNQRHLDNVTRQKSSISARVDQAIRNGLKGRSLGKYGTPLNRLTAIATSDNEPTWRQRGRSLLHDYANNDMDKWPEPAQELLREAFLKAGGMGQYNISGEQAQRLFRKLIATLLKN